MVYQFKHYKFLQGGSGILKVFKDKTYFSIEKNPTYQTTKVIQEYVLPRTQVAYNNICSHITPIFKVIQQQYNKSILPGYISYGSNALSEIKEDIHINPLSKETEEQVKKIDKKHFLTIGVACFLLSSVTLHYHNDQSSFLDININLSHPKENPANQLAQSLHPKFMVPIFQNKLEAFTKLLMITEGEANFFYKDNLGIATAYGWNPTRNSKEFNVDLASNMGMSTSQIKSIEKISASKKTPANKQVQSVPASLKKVVLSEKQIKKSAEYMMTFYEKEFLKVMQIKAEKNGKDFSKILKSYHELPNNQQAVMVHMAYKVGINNLLKYEQFFKELFTYMEQPTTINLEKVTDNFEYSYKTRKGNRLHDTRVEEAHNEFFNKCSIQDSDKIKKEAIKESINYCRNLVATKSIKINYKG